MGGRHDDNAAKRGNRVVKELPSGKTSSPEKASSWRSINHEWEKEGTRLEQRACGGPLQ